MTVLLALAPSKGQQQGASAVGKRAVTVADTINMTRIAGTPFPGVRPKNGFAKFSPDGRRFALVLAKGETKTNTNRYSILLFSTRGREPAKTVITFSSSSNRPGIFDLQWLKDTDTILFLGSRGDSPTQLYSIRCSSGKLTELTRHATSLVSYSYAESPGTIAFVAESAESDLANPQVLRHGIAVETESISDLVRGRLSRREPELYLERLGSRETRLATQGPIDHDFNTVFLSPSGRHVLVKTDVTEAPEIWKGYQDPLVKGHFSVGLRLLRYELVDARSGKSEVLLDSPAPLSLSDVLWSPDSRSLLLSGTYLPLDVRDPAELAERESTKYVVELDLGSREVRRISEENLTPVAWNARTNLVEFKSPGRPKSDGAPQSILFQKSEEHWSRVPLDPRTGSLPLDVLAEQGLNEPPRIVVVDSEKRTRRLVMDLNPQLAHLALGHVEQVEWTGGHGRPLAGALYFPVDFKAGVRYPLVIQTHGFDPQGFWIEGAYATADAAQALAAQGIAVLQMNDLFDDSLETPSEAEEALDAYKTAIEYLSQQGMIDPNRVGLIGFSRTGFYLSSALTRPGFHLAAAVLSDGSTGGYMENVLFSNSLPRNSSEFEAIFEAAPFGKGLPSWVTKSPDFHLDRVETPLEIQALGPTSLLTEWELFSGLRRLGKPVDLLYLPTGTHVLVKPWDRLVSEQGTVDWFCFWLKGQENPSPGSQDQYLRWHKLRNPPGSGSVDQ